MNVGCLQTNDDKTPPVLIYSSETIISNESRSPGITKVKMRELEGLMKQTSGSWSIEKTFLEIPKFQIEVLFYLSKVLGRT